jgi:outer membrane receptor protein involved in Fe transport
MPIRRRVWLRRLAPAAVAASLAPLSAPAFAQGATVDGLEEIIVTARKREENLQDVPLSISVVTAAAIAERGIRDVQDLVKQDSSLNFDDGFAPGDVRIVIRGLSPTRGRPNVASLVDGIDISSEAIGIAGGSLLATPRLLDIEQVEIVKGPQSALFGRSAFAGAINYITKDPSDEFEANINLDGNDGEEYSGTASLSFPLGDTLGVRLNGLWWDEKGFYKNSITGGDVGGGEGKGGAITVKWEPTEGLSFKFRGEYTDDEFDMPAQAFIPFNGTSAVPAAASVCNSPGGFVRDSSCQYQFFNGNRPTSGASNNPAFILEPLATAIGRPGTFNDMTVASFRGQVPDADQLAVTFTPNYRISRDGGLTAPDYEGSQRDVRRYSLVAAWETSYGTFTSLTGYTDANLFSDFDSDKDAIPGATLGSDNSTIENRLTTWGKTEQLSQELRFTSDFDGPVNFVTGLQYWEEKADQYDSNNNVIANGVLCSPGLGPMGALGCIYSETRVGPFMDDLFAARGSNLSERDVDHKSAYLQFNWDVTEKFGLSLEGRYVDEDNSVSGDDPIEIGFAPLPNPMFPGPGQAPFLTYYSDAPNSGNSIVILCGINGPCNPLPPFIPNGAPQNPVRGFFPVGAGVVNNPMLSTTPCPLAGATAPTCIPPGTVLVNPGYIRNTFERSDSYFTPKATFEFKPTDETLLYASYAEGKKPGGFSTLFGGTGLTDRETYEFKPEELKEYELGFKWRVSDRWIVNGALFREDFSDKQVNVQVVPPGSTIVVTRIDNAASAKIDGAEIETTLLAGDYLTLSANFTYLDGEYDDYTILSNGVGEIARVGNCTPEAFPNGSLACRIDRTGNTLEDMPKYAFFGNATYRRPLGATGLTWSIGVDAQYQDERFLEDDNAVVLDSYWLGNVRFGLEGERWSAIAYVNNVTDDDTVRSAGGGPGITRGTWRFGLATGLQPGVSPSGVVAAPRLPTTYFANMPDPRVYGLRLGFRF